VAPASLVSRFDSQSHRAGGIQSPRLCGQHAPLTTTSSVIPAAIAFVAGQNRRCHRQDHRWTGSASLGGALPACICHRRARQHFLVHVNAGRVGHRPHWGGGGGGGIFFIFFWGVFFFFFVFFLDGPPFWSLYSNCDDGKENGGWGKIVPTGDTTFDASRFSAPNMPKT